ncbi:MAG: 50S ribosomal protein L11 methyltransferase, partial [Chitinophagaceae bacterium]|nr:50S ribosomal protein L11 methyltransferase [Chitinophagaceae bacterium]
IRAKFHQPIKNVQHDIIITPKMSFGTGHHATTYMMIEQMHKINFVEKTVFDFGTGTGVLAILAEKLGAASVTAIDNDEWSTTNAQENIHENDCRKIKIELSSHIPSDQTFDVILANINKNVIVQHFTRLTKALNPTRHLLVSGLLAADERSLLMIAESHRLIVKTKAFKDDWLCILFVNRS